MKRKRGLVFFLVILAGIGIGITAGWDLITYASNGQIVAESSGEGKDANETEDIYLTETGLMIMENSELVPYEAELSEEGWKLLREQKMAE